MNSKDDQTHQARTVKALQDAAENTFTKVTLRESLTELPNTLLRHAHSIRFLDISNNDLISLPEWIADLRNLEILFASFNQLVTLPKTLTYLPALQMVGARSNKIEQIHEAAIPSSLRWLTLTDNQITALPETIAHASKIQKLLLAGNRLTTLPPSLARCKNLELLRISANELHEIPGWILNHPALAWVALAGNPVTRRADPYFQRYRDCSIDWSELSLFEELGRGASGITYRGTRTQGNKIEEVAVKVFNSAVSSDGSADDELYGALTARSHVNLLTPLGYFDLHPEGKQGLVYPLLNQGYTALAAPPSFSTITRDVYAPEREILTEQVLMYAKGIVAATAHLHSKNLLHGDLYAHNTLVNGSHALLSDFGATLHVDNLETRAKEGVKRLEVRALGILLSELSDLLPHFQLDSTNSTTRIKATLHSIGEELSQNIVNLRPSPEKVLEKLESIA